MGKTKHKKTKMNNIETIMTKNNLLTSSLSNISVLTEEGTDNYSHQLLNEEKYDPNEESSCDNESKNSNEGEEAEGDEQSLEKKIRQATVAAGGGALVLFGALLTPFPVPGGIPIIAAGLHVLAQEFEEAKVVEERLYENVSTMKTKIQDEYNKQFTEIESSMELRTYELMPKDKIIMPQAITT